MNTLMMYLSISALALQGLTAAGWDLTRAEVAVLPFIPAMRFNLGEPVA
jgi:hypothetical protein